jgi:hypothetical protein
MKTENEKYNKVLNILRNSRPFLSSTEDIETEVIKQIKRADHARSNISEAVDFLFSWVYIGWVRRSLVTASVVLVMIFIYQQGIIIKRIDLISRQTVISDKEIIATPAEQLEKLLMIYKMSGRKFPTENITISEGQMKDLLESVKELQLKYKGLEDLIEGDPELKKLIEQELSNSNRNKVNL